VCNADDEDDSGRSTEPSLECPVASGSEYEVLPEKKTKSDYVLNHVNEEMMDRMYRAHQLGKLYHKI
jgi:hypothetical protein